MVYLLQLLRFYREGVLTITIILFLVSLFCAFVLGAIICLRRRKYTKAMPTFLCCAFCFMAVCTLYCFLDFPYALFPKEATVQIVPMPDNQDNHKLPLTRFYTTDGSVYWGLGNISADDSRTISHTPYGSILSHNINAAQFRQIMNTPVSITYLPYTHFVYQVTGTLDNQPVLLLNSRTELGFFALITLVVLCCDGYYFYMLYTKKI